MELITKEGELNKRQSPLLLDKEYTIYRDGKCLGNAIYMDDEQHGKGFFKKQNNGSLLVFVADEWILN